MPIPEKWAGLEDFAALFQYSGYRDSPVDQKAVDATRIDWTIHIGVLVRSISDIMGLVARYMW